MIGQLKLGLQAEYVAGLAQRFVVGAALALLAGGGGALAQTSTCLTPEPPAVGPYLGLPPGFTGLHLEIPEPTVSYHAHEFRYRLVDAGEAWFETRLVMRSTGVRPRLLRFRSELPEIPTSGPNPGLFEAQVRRFCDEINSSDWSALGNGNVSQPPYFRQRLTLDPLDASYVCEFDEGQTRAGADGRGCRLYARDLDLLSSATTGLVLEIGTESDGPLFVAKRDTIVGTNDPPSAALGNTADDEAVYPLGHIWLVQFRSPPDFEDPQYPDHTYRVPLTLVDEYGIQSETLNLVVRVRNVDEPETWSFAPPPRVGAPTMPASIEGDATEILSFEWERSADLEPRQWKSIPAATDRPYLPTPTDQGHHLRASVQYTDVGGAKSATIPASQIQPNLPPTFDAAQQGTRTLPENSHPDTTVGDPIVATDTPGDPLTYTLVGEVAEFHIDSTTGQLRIKPGVWFDFETKPSYLVVVRATDRTGATGDLPVTVMVTRVQSDGEIADLGEPRVGQELSPRVMDPGGDYGTEPGNPIPVLLRADRTPARLIWQWYISADNGLTWQRLPDGGQRRYTPQATQNGQRLRVVVTYDSPEQPGLQEAAIWTGALPRGIQSVAIVSTPNLDSVYIEGEEIRIAVTFQDPVTMTGTFGIELLFDGQHPRQVLLTADGTAPPAMTWTFIYVVVPGDSASAIGIPAGRLTRGRDARLQDAARRDVARDHPAAAPVAQSVGAIPAGLPDANQDGRLTPADALALYHTTNWRSISGDESNPGNAVLRRTVLGPLLAAGVAHTDAHLNQLLQTAGTMLRYSEQFHLDVNLDGTATAPDILTLYYALAFPELLGDGTDHNPGFASFRQRLLSPVWATSLTQTPDAIYLVLLGRAWDFIP